MAHGPGDVRKIRLLGVVHQGEAGKFCGNAESFGWQRDDGGRAEVYAVTSAKRAEWFQGQLRVLCETEDEEGAAILAMDGFATDDFDTIWRYFEQSCGVYVKKHKPVAALSPEDFDSAMRTIEDAADRVDEAAQGSVQKKGREFDLLKRVESVRDGLEKAVSGDKQALNRVFSANGCERIGRLRLVLDTVQLEVYSKDPRWLHLRKACDTIESVLKELGTFRSWRPPDDQEHSSLLKRLMVRELRQRHGWAGDSEAEGGELLAEGSEAGLEHLRQHQQPEPAAREPCPVDGRALAAGAAHFGAPHPVYGHALPEQPGDALQPEQPQEQPAEPMPEGGDDGGSTEGEDEEVLDPNSVPASAPDDRRSDSAAGGGSRKSRITHPGSLLEGWVWKRSRFLRRWRRRWLVLMPQHLMSFKHRGHAKATETMHAGTVLRVYSADAEVLQSRCFGVALSRRTHFMVCDDEAQKQAWIRGIHNALVTTAR